MPKTIKQKVTFKCSPKAAYEALMDSKKHAQIIGDTVKMSKKPGEAFSAYGGSIAGITLEMVPGKRIVQAWRYEDWPEGHYSVAIWEFKPVGKNTVMEFTQISVPDGKAKQIEQGWMDYYWNPMKTLLEK